MSAHTSQASGPDVTVEVVRSTASGDTAFIQLREDSYTTSAGSFRFPYALGGSARQASSRYVPFAPSDTEIAPGSAGYVNAVHERPTPDASEVAILGAQRNEARAFFDRMVGRYQAGPGFDPNHLYYPED